jgi:hypothetical protein
MNKPFYESKTILFNALSIILVVFQAVTQQNIFNIDTETQAMIFSAINLALRMTSDNKTLTVK